jgi:hypothetical protein
VGRRSDVGYWENNLYPRGVTKRLFLKLVREDNEHRNMKSIIPSLSIVALLFGGCVTDSGMNTPTSFPQDNSWVYSTQSFDANGNAVGAVTYDSVFVASQKDGIFYLSDSSADLKVKDGLIVEYNNIGSNCNTQPIPSTLGDTTFKVNSVPAKIAGQIGATDFRIFGVKNNTVVTVPAGTFNCTEYILSARLECPNIYYAKVTYFISPSAGLVKSETFDTDTATNKLYLTGRKELIKFVQ